MYDPIGPLWGLSAALNLDIILAFVHVYGHCIMNTNIHLHEISTRLEGNK